MAVSPIILVFLSIGALCMITGAPSKAGEITCDAKSKEALSKDGAGSKIGKLSQGTSAKCLLELETSCQGCYMDIVFWKMELASTKPTKQPRTSLPVALDNAIIVREQGKASTTIFTGNLTGVFFLTSAKTVKIEHDGGSVKKEINWKISYAVREITHKSCYWGVNLRYTCPNNKCTDDPYECEQMTKHFDIPAAGITKENKTKIFMGIIGALALVVLIFILILFCRKNWEKIVSCLLDGPCKCCDKPRKRHDSGMSATNVQFEIRYIISGDDLNQTQDPTESQTAKEDSLPTYEEVANSDGYQKLKDKEEEE